MSATATVTPNVYPVLGYRDAAAAVDWLCAAFGFEALMVHEGADRREVVHAELGLTPGIVMLGSLTGGASGAERSDTNEVDFATVPFSVYVAVDDVDAHCARARAAGATIAREPADTDYGTREYACRDLEHNVWSFGTYRPIA